MTPTSDERREVARRLRTEVGEGECIDCAAFRIVHDVTGVEDAMGARAGRILADLTDPTCHVVGTTGHEGVYPNGETHCAHEPSCGHEVTTAWPDPPDRCQHCGARVTSGGER